MRQTDIPAEIPGLVERFERNLDAYRSEVYNETRLRIEFLDPFFKALGWDVDNESGTAEASARARTYPLLLSKNDPGILI
jgi:hypothetical protein